MPTIICLLGPTAVGKTALALALTQQLPFSCNIISVDSGMVYRGMDIGTAKPTAAETALAPHLLIDILDPNENYSAAQFCLDATKAIQDIWAVGKIPLLVGGTMLYFYALQHGLSTLPPANKEIRAQLNEEALKFGWQHLYAKLQHLDPTTASRLSSTDTQRIQRALEVYELTGCTMSELHAANPPEKFPYDIINIAIIPRDRERLRKKIAQRFDLMLQQGLIDEVEALKQRGDLHLDLPSMRTVGYRQTWQYLQGEINYEEMKERILNATNQLAKRQMTWLKKWDNLTVFDGEGDSLQEKVVEFLKRAMSL